MPNNRAQAEAGWTHWDALFLVAIVTARGCALDTLIYESDARDRSYPTELEASSSLGRLIASGLITADERRFKATDIGRQTVRKTLGPWWRRWRSGTIEQVGLVLTYLRKCQPVEGTWSFASGELDDAIHRYLRSTARR